MSDLILQGIITCRSVSPDGDWYHLIPSGEIDAVATIKGKRQAVTLVVDDEAMDRIIAAMAEDAAEENWEGYLVSKEHFAHQDDQSTEAHAWCVELQKRPTGLWGRFEKTPLGEESIGSIYKYRSPVMDLAHVEGRRWRPVHITDIGLTNRPMFKTLAAAHGRAADNPKEDAMLERLQTILGLPDASEDQVVARVQEALGKETELGTVKAELSTLQGSVLAREAEAFVDEHKDRIADTDEARAKVKARYIADAEGTKEMFASMRAIQGGADAGGDNGGQRVLARAGAKSPDGSALPDEDSEQARLRAREQETFVAQVQKEIGCRTRAEARAVAEDRKPELFA